MAIGQRINKKTHIFPKNKKAKRCVLCNRMLTRGGRPNKTGFCHGCKELVLHNRLDLITKKINLLKKRMKLTLLTEGDSK